MVRNYKRKRPQTYSKEGLIAAISAIKEKKTSVLAASQKFGVPKSTLRDHLKDSSRKIGAGHPTIFSHMEEKEIVLNLQALQEIGFGLTRELAGVVLHDYLSDQPHRPNPFKSNIPGNDWWMLFMKRWSKELSWRKPGHLQTHRAIGSSKEALDEWYLKVEKLFEKTGMSSMNDEDMKQRIWNCDETGFCLSATSKKILAKRGDRDVHETMGGSGREYITLLGSACADGTRLPPYILYKGKHLWSRWMKGGPAGSMYSVSDSGWMESANFLQWFEKMFIPAVAHLNPVFLFFDGHHSHLTLRLVELARQKGIHLVCFPPHATHLLQPLDLGVFGPLKSSWKKIMKKYQVSTCASIVTKEEFPSLIAELYDISFLPSHVRGGFQKAGLYPFDKDVVPQTKLSKALPFTSQNGRTRSTSESSTSSDQSELSEVSMSESSDHSDDYVSVKVVGSCTLDDRITTPVRLELKYYFADILKKKNNYKKSSSDTRKVKPNFYGEALTSDELYDRLMLEEEEKKKQKEEKERKREEQRQKKEEKKEEQKKRKEENQKEREKKRKEKEIKKQRKVTPSTKIARRKSKLLISAQNVTASISSRSSHSDASEFCQECHLKANNDEEFWIGCDSCSNWYHYTCLGLAGIPASNYWCCPECEICD